MEMKRYTLALITGACLIGVSASAQADRDKTTVGEDTSSAIGKIKQGAKNILTEMKFEDLPPAVQATVRQQSGGTKITDIDREDRTGKTVYEIEFEKDGDNTEIHVADDGSVLPEEATGLAARTDRDSVTGTGTDRTRVRASMSPKFSELPAAVQQTVQQHGAQAEIEDIDREARDGKTVYEIEFRREGPNREIVVAEDGTLIKQETAVGRPGTARDAAVGADGTSVPKPTTPPANEVK
jgi:uncharacterized membrane protein YkoI